jgi:hypothetical protein
VGSVKFTSNGVTLGIVPLTGGSASLSTSSLTLGSDTIVATYVPSPNYLASVNSLTQVVVSEVLLLDKTGQGALTVSGKARIDATGATIIVNSTSAKAVIVTGNGQVTADVTNVVGGTVVNGNGSIVNVATTPSVGDPLASVNAPALLSQPLRSIGTRQITSGAVTLQPGLYLGGISISGNAAVTLAPGTYYLLAGGFSVSGQASVTGQGVLLYNAPICGAGQISFSGSARVTLSPQTSGPLAGIAIFQDRTANAAINISGTARLNVAGIIYAANAMVNISGTAIVDTFGYSLIVDDLNMSGNSRLLV